MAPQQRIVRPSTLDRLDLAIAAEAATSLENLDAEALLRQFPRSVPVPRSTRDGWISGILALRGFKLDPSRVRGVLEDRPDDHCSRQERVFIHGLNRALGRILARGRDGVVPDGWSMVELFRDVTQGLPRFSNNHLRRDVPWDAQRHVSSPRPDAIAGMLDRFTPGCRFLDVELAWERAHPVRRAFRAMWRFARIAPFPDFNRMFAFVFMDAFLLAHGYPLLVPEPSDRQLLDTLTEGGVPQRIVQLESRLLSTVPWSETE